jgi:serine/threonine protein kinase
MPAPSTADEFVDLVRKSAVLDEPRLAEYVHRLKSDPAAPRDPSGVAGLFVRDGLLTYFQAEQFLQGKWKRFSIGKYKVLEKLGSGGMGQVFLCEHKLMRRRVAVKVLPVNKAQDPSSLERFYREARAVAALDHPNIVRAYDIDQDDNLHFLVMEYVDGSSMQDMIKKTGPMDPNRACHYMYWSAVGLQHAHANGLIHRDIKPGNILVDRTGVVKILDLGLARFFNDTEDLLTKKYDESVLGTADYLAPEQAVDSHTVDGRADIYSLGATFYFLLTGQPPFAEGTVAQKLLWHQTRSPKPIRDLRPQVPGEVIRVIEKMMSKKPEDRYATPGQLADVLLPFTQTPIPPPPAEEMPQLSVAAQGTGQVPMLVSPRSSGGPKTPPPAHAPRTPSMPAPAAPQPAGKVAVASPGPNRTKPAPVVEPLPEQLPVAQFWAAISGDTARDAKADTDKAAKKDGKSSRRSIPKPPKPKSTIRHPAPAPRTERQRHSRRSAVKIWIFIATIAALVLGAAAVYLFVIRGKDKKLADGPRTLVLTKSADEPNEFGSLRQAMADVREGDTLVIQDDEWEEAGMISRVKNVKLMAAPGKRVTWRPPAGQRATALLTLLQAEGATVSGINFLCDARADYAVRLAGPCPGLKLDGLEMADANIAALGIAECTGGSRPVTISNARLTDAALGPDSGRANSRMGMQFLTVQKGSSHDVHIVECKIEGTFPGGAIVFDAGATGIEIKDNQVKAAYGLVFHKAANAVWRVNFTKNTFESTRFGVQIDDLAQMERTDPPNQIRFSQNHFSGGQAVSNAMGGSKGKPIQFLVADGNTRKGTATNIGTLLIPTAELK